MGVGIAGRKPVREIRDFSLIFYFWLKKKSELI